MKNWPASEAKLHFSQIIDDSVKEPQIVLRRGKPVSVVVGYSAFTDAGSRPGEKSTRKWLEELQEINRREEDFCAPERSDREQPDWAAEP